MITTELKHDLRHYQYHRVDGAFVRTIRQTLDSFVRFLTPGQPIEPCTFTKPARAKIIAASI